MVREEHNLNKSGKSKMPLIHFKWNSDYENLANQIINEDD